ncbi:MAG: NAD(P)-dependent oxidoreductase [Actinomycetota bacterium]|nr:NAD(P)-dependent oxidoreductase [Actinomycetota bacterium]
MKVLVTGASGFLGGSLCTELARRGHEPVAMVRQPDSGPANVAEVRGDLADAGSLRDAFASSQPEVVVHLAAEIASQRSAVKVRQANVEGTKRLIEAAEAAGTRRLVFASTVVTGDAGGELLDETTTLPVQTAYGTSKQEGERLVRDSGLEDVVLRPSHVYGAGGWFEEEFVKRLRQPGRFAVIGRGDNWWDVVRDADVVQAFVLAVERAAPGSTYHVVDDEPIRFYDFVALTAQELGLGPPRRVPAWLARLAAGADPVTAVTRSARSSNARIKQDLGWAPRFATAQQGIPDAVAAIGER